MLHLKTMNSLSYTSIQSNSGHSLHAAANQAGCFKATREYMSPLEGAAGEAGACAVVLDGLLALGTSIDHNVGTSIDHNARRYTTVYFSELCLTQCIML